jgi:hypothetical protein
MADDNQMKQFAPVLIGAGLLASVFWFGKGERRLPREFGSLGITKKEAERRFRVQGGRFASNVSNTDRRLLWNDYVDNLHSDGEITDKQVNSWSQPKWLKKRRFSKAFYAEQDLYGDNSPAPGGHRSELPAFDGLSGLGGRVKGFATKYVVEYIVQGNYGHGWDDLTAHDTRRAAVLEARVYADNEPNAHRVIIRRVLRG